MFQDISCHEVLFKASKLLDQFCEGTKQVQVLELVRAYPDLFVHLFTFTGDLVAEDVMDAVYVHSDTQLYLGNKLILSFLKHYIQECSQEGKILCWAIPDSKCTSFFNFPQVCMQTASDVYPEDINPLQLCCFKPQDFTFSMENSLLMYTLMWVCPCQVCI